jgi:spermidine synthase
VLGDGRLMLEREPAQNFDLLAIDAFSGDSIPTHLLTSKRCRRICVT